MESQTTIGYATEAFSDSLLGQPIQGSHPGESGRSTLAYLLEDQAVIPPDRGIFLATSWRMHPSICDFISTTVYDDRLQAEPSTALRVIKVPDGTDRLRVEVGLHFVPVVHEGNSRSSEEEAEMIKALAHELLGREKTDTSGTVIGTIGWEDMLFVAPYNVQVNCYSRYWETKPKWARWIGFKGRNRRLYSCPCAPVQSKIQLVASTFCSTKTA